MNIFLGRSFDAAILIDDDILSHEFGFTKEIDQVPVEQFVTNLISFFENEGVALLSGDKEVWQHLTKYQEDRSEQYTTALREKQLRFIFKP